MTQRTVLLFGCLIALLLPPLVFLLAGLAEGMHGGEILMAGARQYAARRQNLGVVSLLGLFPIAMLGVILWIARRFNWQRLRGASAVVAGLLPVLLVILWVNAEFWPIFLPEQRYPGFPHGLEFVLGPGFYAPLGMLMGLFLHGCLGPAPRA